MALEWLGDTYFTNNTLLLLLDAQGTSDHGYMMLTVKWQSNILLLYSLTSWLIKIELKTEIRSLDHEVHICIVCGYRNTSC